jgi:hypothetical protein
MPKVTVIVEDTFIEEVGTVEELFLFQDQLHVIQAGWQGIGLDAPEWIQDKLVQVETEIKLRVKAELQRKLRNAKNRREALRTADEKRNILDAEIAALENRLK